MSTLSGPLDRARALADSAIKRAKLGKQPFPDHAMLARTFRDIHELAELLFTSRALVIEERNAYRDALKRVDPDAAAAIVAARTKKGAGHAQA